MSERKIKLDTNALIDKLIKGKTSLAMQMKGYSMFPTLRPGDIGIVVPVTSDKLIPGMVVAFRSGQNRVAHRLVKIKYEDGQANYICRGDNNSFSDQAFYESDLVGIITEFERDGKLKSIKKKNINFILQNPKLFYLLNRSQFKINSFNTRILQFNNIYFKQWKKILQHSGKDFYTNLIITFFQSVLPLVMIYLVKLIVDQLSADKAQVDFNQIFLLLGGAGLSYLLSGILGEIRGYYQEKLTQSVSKYTYKYIQDIHKDLEFKNYEIPDSLNLIHQAAYESSFRPMRMISNGMNLFRAIVSSLLILAMFISVDWNFIFILVLAILPRLILKIRFAKRYFNFRKAQGTDERAMFYYNRVITTQAFAKEMRLFDISKLFQSKFNHTQERLHKDKQKILASEIPLASITHIFGITLIFYSLGKLIMDYSNNLLSLGSLVLVFFLFQRAFSTLNDLFQSLANLVEDYHFLKILKSFEELTKTRNKVALNNSVKEFKGLKVRNLDFTYPQSKKQTLHQINLDLLPGQTIALVGANGSGKTTLIKLLAGLYETSNGEIIINGENYDKLTFDQIRQNITAVFQDYASYFITAAENISLGDIKKGFDLDKIKDAALHADMDKYIQQFPRKLHQMMGNYFEDSVELSIGQWQKMAIARAIYSDAPLLLLDEPTSALDAASELHIVELMRKMTHNRSTVIVSHQLSMVEWVDRIYCFKEGEIVEQGTHQELLDYNGEYARLYAAHHYLKS